jgi:hypothetical protein
MPYWAQQFFCCGKLLFRGMVRSAVDTGHHTKPALKCRVEAWYSSKAGLMGNCFEAGFVPGQGVNADPVNCS